jgi:hypothetical protein
MSAEENTGTVSISVSFEFVRERPPSVARTLRRRSRTVPIGDGHCTGVLKIGRSAVRPRPWPPHLTCTNDSSLDLFLRAPSQLSARAILYRSGRKWTTVKILAAINVCSRNGSLSNITRFSNAETATPALALLGCFVFSPGRSSPLAARGLSVVLARAGRRTPVVGARNGSESVGSIISSISHGRRPLFPGCEP